jgi:1,4-dihydroxy-2-naphthoyl-CoA hydrolase
MNPNEISPDHFNKLQKNTLMEVLNIEITKVGEDFIEGTMPVDHRTKQPFGLLHGGASAALAETLGSYGATMFVDLTKYIVVGTSIQSNHLKGATEGVVTGRASIIHKGSKMHVWEIEIKDQNNRLINKSSLSVMIVEKKK